MTDRHEEGRSLIPIGQTLPALLPDRAGGSVMQRMARGALDIAQQYPRATGSKRYRLGGHELCEPDYRQVLLWAERLGMTPEEIIARLSAARAEIGDQETVELRIVEGHIRSLVWDGKELPLDRFEWLPGLAVETLAVEKVMPAWLPEQRLPSIKRLYVQIGLLTTLDLSPVPGLTELHCSGTPLSVLDLSPVPGLTKLYCVYTELTDLRSEEHTSELQSL